MSKPFKKDLRIFFEAGHGGKDSGAIAADNSTEASLTLELRNLVVAALRGMNYAGAIVIDPDDADLGGALRMFKPNADDILVGLHFNSGPPSATGTECIVPNKPYSQLEVFIATELSAAIASALGIQRRSGSVGLGVKEWKETARGAGGENSGWLNQNGHTCIVEVCYITNLTELNKYRSNIKSVSKAIAQVIIKVVDNYYQ